MMGCPNMVYADIQEAVMLRTQWPIVVVRLALTNECLEACLGSAPSTPLMSNAVFSQPHANITNPQDYCGQGKGGGTRRHGIIFAHGHHTAETAFVRTIAEELQPTTLGAIIQHYSHSSAKYCFQRVVWYEFLSGPCNVSP